MAKRTKKRPREATRKELARTRKARRQERIILIVGGLVLALVVAILGFGYYQEKYAKLAAPVAVVNGTPISTGAYQKMVRYRRYALTTAYSRLRASMGDTQDVLAQYFQSQMDNLPMQVLEDMINEELIRQGAAQNGISVSPQEVQRAIEEEFGYWSTPPTPTPTPVTTAITVTVTPAPTTPPLTREQFEERFQETLSRLKSQAGFSEADFRGRFEADLLRDKFQEFLASRVPTTEQQVHVRHILVETKEEAERVLERLKQGEDFATLAQELSQDPGSKDKGGDLGWFPRGQMAPEFDEVAFTLPPGGTSEVVQTASGFHIIQVLEREDDRELAPDLLEQRRDNALDAWLQAQHQSATIERFWSPDKVPPFEEGAGGTP
ncbi:MAG: peptidylprolyl isomerase [Anaerolineae bacterium]